MDAEPAISIGVEACSESLKSAEGPNSTLDNFRCDLDPFGNQEAQFRHIGLAHVATATKMLTVCGFKCKFRNRNAK